ncbi:hypothetical protein ACIQMZ_35535 [Streptomyces longwoodensis]|uniref:hypothetical protein n=1 Tax=Streptomyces longwoodensis TaxID=68231 RepID=UPI00380D9731
MDVDAAGQDIGHELALGQDVISFRPVGGQRLVAIEVGPHPFALEHHGVDLA